MSVRRRAAGLLRAAPEQEALVDVAAGLRPADIARRFWPRLRPLRGWLLLGLLLLTAAPAIAVAEAFLYQRLVDDVLVPAAFEPLLALALLYIGLNLASGVVSGADDYLATFVSQRFLVDLRRDVFAHVLSLPAATHDRRRLGDTLTRLTSDVAAVERFMVTQASEGVGALVRLLVLVGALMWMDWRLALASLVVVPLFWWVSTRFARLTRDVSRERRRRGGSLGSVTEEALGNAALVQSYGREDRAVASYDGHNRAIAGAELAASRIRALFLPLVDLAELVGVLVVVGLGVWSLADGAAHAGRAAGLPHPPHAVLRAGARRWPTWCLRSTPPARASSGSSSCSTSPPAATATAPRRCRAVRARCRSARRRTPIPVRRARARRAVARRRGGRDRRDRRPERVGQVHPRPAPVAAARRRHGRRRDRRPRRRRADRRVGARRRHGRPPGAAHARRVGARQPRPRPARRLARRGARRGTRRGCARVRRGAAARATTPGSASAAAPCRAVSGSGSRSRGPCCDAGRVLVLDEPTTGLDAEAAAG